MGKVDDVLGKAFSRYLTGFALSKAILEDYIKVVAKLEKLPEQEIKDRIWKRTDEIFNETRDQQLKETEKAKNIDESSSNSGTN